MIPPTIYYSKVALELSRMVFQGQKMSPPYVSPSLSLSIPPLKTPTDPTSRNISAFQSYLQPALSIARRPTSLLAQQASETSTMNPEHILSRLRNVNRAQLASAGVIAAEVLGFFTVGEMLGRMKLVGYRGDREHHETATPHEGMH